MDQTFLQTVSDLGGTLSALAFAGWLIIYLLKGFQQERTAWMDKDTENDTAMRGLMSEYNRQIITVISDTNKVLKDMTVAISELKETIHNEKK